MRTWTRSAGGRGFHRRRPAPKRHRGRPSRSRRHWPPGKSPGASARRPPGSGWPCGAQAAAGLGNHDEIAALGHWLLAPDLRAKQEAGKALFPFLTKDRHDPFGRGRGEPRHIVLRLEASAAGCRWLIDRWAKLRAWLDQGADWRTNELIAALQLRGQRPLGKDAIEWQDLVEPILPTGNPEAIAEARAGCSRSSPPACPTTRPASGRRSGGWWTRRRSGCSAPGRAPAARGGRPGRPGRPAGGGHLAGRGADAAVPAR